MRRDDMEFYGGLDSQYSSYRRQWIPNSSYPRESPSYREEYHHSSPSPQRDPYSSSTNHSCIWDGDSYGYSHQHHAPSPPQDHGDYHYYSPSSPHYSHLSNLDYEGFLSFRSRAQPASRHPPQFSNYQRQSSINYSYARESHAYRDESSNYSSSIPHDSYYFSDSYQSGSYRPTHSPPDYHPSSSETCYGPQESHRQISPPITGEASPQSPNSVNGFSQEEIEAIRALIWEAKAAYRGHVELLDRRASETTQKRPPPPPPTLIQASPPPELILTPPAAPPPGLVLTPLAAPPPELILTPPAAPPPELILAPLKAPPPELILTPATAPPPELILTAPTAPPPERHPVPFPMTFSLAPEQTSTRLSVRQPFFYLSFCHSVIKVIKVILAPPPRALQMVQLMTVRLPLPVTDCHENIADEMPRRRLWDPGGQKRKQDPFQP